MAIPTDRGYAVIISNPDATTTVLVCAAVEHGQPVDVYAKHVRAPKVRIDPSVRLAGAGRQRYTTQIVEVFPANGAVQVRAPLRHRALPA